MMRTLLFGVCTLASAAISAAQECPASTQLSSVPSVMVRGFDLYARQPLYFSRAKLDQKLLPYVNRCLTMEELGEAQEVITKLYQEAGLVNSEVAIPDQEIKDGKVQFMIVEGRLRDVDVSGTSRLSRGYVKRLAERGLKTRLDVNQLLANLEVLLETPAIETVNATLVPSGTPAQADVLVTIRERRPFSVGVEFSNYQSPAVGSWRGRATASHLNLTGHADSLQLDVNRTSGISDVGVRYSHPISSNETMVSAHFRSGQSLVVERPFNLIDIQGTARTIGAGVSRTFRVRRANAFDGLAGFDGDARRSRTSGENAHRRFVIGAAFDVRSSQTFLLGEPFSFDERSDNGEARIAAIRITNAWTSQTLTSTMSAQSVLTLGRKLSPEHPPGSDRDFLVWTGHAQWARTIARNRASVFTRTGWQLTSKALLPLERYAVGGHQSVRGYRENQLASDNAIEGSIEGRLRIVGNLTRSVLQLAAFTDGARGWNREFVSETRNDLASVGMALILQVGARLNVRIDKAVLVIARPERKDTLQDRGYHIGVSYQLTGDRDYREDGLNVTSSTTFAAESTFGRPVPPTLIQFRIPSCTRSNQSSSVNRACVAWRSNSDTQRTISSLFGSIPEKS